MSDAFTAVAPVAGSLVTDPCRPSQPYPTAEQSLDTWIELDGCANTPTVDQVAIFTPTRPLAHAKMALRWNNMPSRALVICRRQNILCPPLSRSGISSLPILNNRSCMLRDPPCWDWGRLRWIKAIAYTTSKSFQDSQVWFSSFTIQNISSSIILIWNSPAGKPAPGCLPSRIRFVGG